MKRTILILLILPLLATLVFAQPPSAEHLRENRAEIARAIQAAQDEAILLQIWQRPEVDEDILFLKMLAGKRLGLYGTEAAVPVLAARLGNEMDGFFARYALETIPGAAVDIALGEALKTIEKPDVIAGILTTLGVRANPVSAEAAIPFLTHEDADVRQAAAYAFSSTARGDALTSLFRVGKDIPFPVDSAFLLAERARQRGDYAFAASVYATIQIGELRFEPSPGRLLFDTKEYQWVAAGYHFYDISARYLNQDIGFGLMRQLGPTELGTTTSRRQFEMGLRAGRLLPADEEATVARLMLGQLLRQTDPLRAAKIIRALGDRTDEESKTVALPVIARLAQSGDIPIRIAAIDALRNVGDVSVVPMLIRAATQTDEPRVADAARNTLIEMSGEGIDEAILTALGHDGIPATVKIALMHIVAERRIFAASPILLTLLQDSDASVSEAAVSALGQISGVEDLPVLLGLLRGASSEAESQKLLNVLMSACTRFSQEAAATKVANALEGASTTLKTQLLDLLKEIAGAKALAIVEEYAWGEDAAMRNVATRILGEWRSPPDLDQLAAACLRLARESEEFKIRGLRAYIRLARQFDMPEERRLSIAQEVFDLADRDEDQVLIFDVFARAHSIRSLETTIAYLDNATFRERAAETAVGIAERLQGRDARIINAMRKILEVSTTAQVRERAQRVIDR